MSPDLSIDSRLSVGQRIAANTGLLVGAKALAVILGLLSLIITERALDDQVAFGTIIFLHAYMLFFAEVATFQSWQSLIRFGTEDVKEGSATRLSGLIKFCAILDFLSAVGAFVAAVGLFGLVTYVMTLYPNLFPQSEALNLQDLQKLLTLYCTVVLFRQIGMGTGLLRLFNKFKGLAVNALIMPLTRFIGVCIAFVNGWDMYGFICVWYAASLVGYIFNILLGVFELYKRRLMGRVWQAKSDFTRPREGLWPFVWKSNVDSTLAAGLSHLPVLLVMASFGPAFVAVYRVAEEIAKLLSEGVKLLDQVIYPELARIMTDGGARRIWRIVARAGLISLGISLVLSIIIMIFGPSVIAGTLGPEYSQTVILAVILVIGAALFAAVAPLYPVFYAANRPEQAIYARIAGMAVYIAAFFILIPRFDGLGAAWAVVAGQAVSLVLSVWLVRGTLSRAIAAAETST